MPNNNPFIPAPGPSTASASKAPDMFEVDLSNAESNLVIPDGTYKVKCIDIDQQVSKGGNPMFVWTFEIVGGEKEGFTLKVFSAITPAAMWKVAETVVALGVGQAGEVVKFKRSDVVGKECGAMVEKTEYNGTERSQIIRCVSLEDMKAMEK